MDSAEVRVCFRARLGAERFRRAARPLTVAVAAALILLAAACSRGPGEAKISSYVQAAALFDSGRFAETVAAIDAARLCDGGFAPALILRGKASFYEGEGDAAESDFRKAAAARPSSAEARLWLARALRSGRKSAEAALLLEELLADDPFNHRALRAASEAALDRGDAAAARAYLDRSAEAVSEAGLAFLDRARFRWADGETESALEDIRAAAAVLPKRSAAHRAAISLEAAIEEKAR